MEKIAARNQNGSFRELAHLSELLDTLIASQKQTTLVKQETVKTDAEGKARVKFETARSGQELEYTIESDPYDADTDDDGLIDGREHNIATDTDGDGDPQYPRTGTRGGLLWPHAGPGDHDAEQG